MAKKYFLFSDVHGECSALLKSLETKGFDHKNPEHILVSLGDNFDRGDENLQVFLFLDEYRKKERLIGIMGNHDEMLYNFLIGIDDGTFNVQHNGLDRTLFELSGRLNIKKFIYDYPDIIIGKIKEKNPTIMKFLTSLVNKVEINEYILTHAGYSIINKYSFEEFKWVVDNWSKTPDFIRMFPTSPDYQKDKKYVFGHWHAFRLHDQFLGVSINPDTGLESRKHGIFEYQNFIGMDSCANISKFINILVIDDKQ